MIEYKIIKDLGLGDKEAAVYIACLSGGALNVTELSREAGVQRTHLYDITKKMVAGGYLVQGQAGNKKVFSAISPKELLKEQQDRLKEFEDNIEALERLGKTKTGRPKVVYFEGRRELDKMMEASTMSGGECLIFGDDYFYTSRDKNYQKKNIEQRLSAGTKCRLIAAVSNAALESQKADKKEGRETRLIPKDMFEAKVHITLYKDRMLVANHPKNFGFMVEDEDLADTMKMIFELIWGGGKIIR